MTMKNFLFFIKSYIKVIVSLSLAGLITITLLNIEKISFFENKSINILNLGGTVQVPISEKTKSNEDKTVLADEKTQTAQVSERNVTTFATSNTVPSTIVPDAKIPQINNSASTAFMLENDSEYSDNLIKRDEKRFYKLNLGNNSAVSLFFSASGMSSYKLSIQDENAMNMEVEVYEEYNFTKNMKVYLRPGTYTIKITGGEAWKENKIGNKYKLRTLISNSVFAEAEINNTEQTANIIPINTEIKASSYKSDVDYFAFALDKRTLISPRLDFASVDDYDFKLYELRIEDEYGGTIEVFNFRGSNQLSGKKKSVPLNAGKYLVHISRIEESKLKLGFHEYTLRVSSEI